MEATSMSVRKGFTLIELLVVIAIIALLVSMLMPSLNSAKALARRAICASNQRVLGVTLKLYCAEQDQQFPVAGRWYLSPSTVKYSWEGTGEGGLEVLVGGRPAAPVLRRPG